ncbi:hypothetical protein TNCV_1576601 [Trichonephila clavipes]|nr:hypothetical protein TNCV_1576601 [Trichonephila clavipes]
MVLGAGLRGEIERPKEIPYGFCGIKSNFTKSTLKESLIKKGIMPANFMPVGLIFRRREFFAHTPQQPPLQDLKFSIPILSISLPNKETTCLPNFKFVRLIVPKILGWVSK